MAGGIIKKRRVLKKLNPGSGGVLAYDDFYNQDLGLSNLIKQLIINKSVRMTESGKLRLVLEGKVGGPPWFFVRQSTSRDCSLWHDIYFDMLGFIPFGCMQCWKVVIVTHPEPVKQTVLDLFKLRDVLIALNLPSKCGADVRSYTPNRYDGFIYADSPREGLTYYSMVKERLAEVLPHAKVILKRGCTEYELVLESSKWIYTQEQAELERKLETIFESTPSVNPDKQMSLGSSEAFRFWIEYAHGIGDDTWREALIYQGYEDPGESLFPKPVLYHDMTVNQINDVILGKEVGHGSSLRRQERSRSGGKKQRLSKK